MNKFEICLAVGCDPDFFTGDHKAAEDFILSRTPATHQEIASAMVMSRFFENEVIVARDEWVVSVTCIRG